VSARAEREVAVWQLLRSIVLDRYDYRREVADALGMSFIRAKALRHIAAQPVTMRELTGILSTDASYTTIVVDDLEARGLVVRTPHREDRRAKVVTATGAGRKAARRAESILSRPPHPMTTLTEEELAALERIAAVLNDPASLDR
jgi:DNA-binding MarR family transcriptional regulator